MIVVFKFFVPRGFNSITLYPFVFLKDKKSLSDCKLINHEKIHLRQQLELLIIPFYVLYIIEFLIKLIIYKNRNQAYFAISFEREAYSNEHDFKFLLNRSYCNFIHYF